ncbi:MAG TPA: hypothetical protein VIC62_19330 [Nakamurella sp.]
MSRVARSSLRSRSLVAGSLSDAGLSCTGMTADVDTGSFRPGGVVTVTITCTADLSGLALSGLPGTATIRATGRSPLEAHPPNVSAWGSVMTPRPGFRRPLCAAIARRWTRIQRDRDGGSITAYLLIRTVALVVLAGLVPDGGAALAAHGRAADTAQQAARAGVDALDEQ